MQLLLAMEGAGRHRAVEKISITVLLLSVERLREAVVRAEARTTRAKTRLLPVLGLLRTARPVAKVAGPAPALIAR